MIANFLMLSAACAERLVLTYLQPILGSGREERIPESGVRKLYYNFYPRLVFLIKMSLFSNNWGGCARSVHGV